MAIETISDVDHHAVSDAFDRVGTTLTNTDFVRDILPNILGVGLPTDFADRIIRQSQLLRATADLQASLQDQYEGESYDPQAVTEKVKSLMAIVHQGAEVARTEGADDAKKLARLVAVGEPISSIRDARAVLGKVLNTFKVIDISRLKLTAKDVATAEALSALFVSEVNDRDDVLVSRMVATQNLYKIKAELIGMGEQLVAKAELAELRNPGLNVVGLDFGELRALAATSSNREEPAEPAVTPEPPPGL